LIITAVEFQDEPIVPFLSDDLGVPTETVATPDYTEVLAKIDALNTTQSETNFLLIFLIGTVCGIAFAKSFFKGWS